MPDEPKGETQDEGAAPRDTVVTFATQHLSYYAGEVAAFTAAEAAHLAGLGVTGDGSPVNTAVPYVEQVDASLTCTMGEWIGEPTDYAYQWQADGADIGTGTPYAVTAAEIGKTMTCVVTATNAVGSKAAPASNAVVVVEPAAHATEARRKR